ncbi:MAG: cobaltochelatase CobT-related protein, partial [Alphaproteobacteria bacterium]
MDELYNPITNETEDSVKNRLSATYRAIAKDKDIDVTFGANSQASNFEKSVRLPNIATNSQNGLNIARGEADFSAFKYRFHDADIHRQKRPSDETHAMLFNALEDARIEAVGSNLFKGASENIDNALNNRYEKMDIATTANHLGENGWAEALRLIARQKFSGKNPPQCTEKLLELHAEKNSDKLQSALDKLMKHINNQEDFATAVRNILTALDNNADYGDEGDNENQDKADDNERDNEQLIDDSQSQSMMDENQTEQENLEDFDGDTSDMETEDGDDNDSEFEGDGETEETPSSNTKHNTGLFDYSPEYKAYTTEFDTVEKANEIAEEDELNLLRKKLDDIVANYNTLVSRIANRLQRKLQAQQLRSWEFDLEEGLLDSAKLTRVVTNPLQSLSFKQEDNSKFKDTVVTLLIDNSGSMRGRPISIAAMTCDILTRTLERCGVKVEVLGFTTVNWKGGSSFKKWDEAGRPENPGRLNDLRHIIYKSADENYNRSKNNFGLLLKEGLLKENIDG